MVGLESLVTHPKAPTHGKLCHVTIPGPDGKPALRLVGKPLTLAQAKVLGFFVRAKLAGKGYPSVREVARKMRVLYMATMSHIQALQQKGYLANYKGHRATNVLPFTWEEVKP